MSFEKFRRLRIPFNNLFEKEGNPNRINIKHEMNSSPTLNNDGSSIMTHPIYSYYADFQENRYYENFANALIERCKSFGVPYSITKRDSRGSYGANCLMKPEFILEKLKESKSPLIWMDCDTDFRSPFTEFNQVGEDIGMATHSGDIHGIKASPLFFNYTAGAFAIVREWVVHCRAAYVKNLPELDHDALKHYVLPYLKGKYSHFLLSQNWHDFVHGKYIFNGNSRVEGKMEIHHKMGIDDDIRANYSAGVKTFHVYLNGDTPSVFTTGLNFLDNFSNYTRIHFHFPSQLKKHEESDAYKMLLIESGGNSSFSDLAFDSHVPHINEIVLDVTGVCEIHGDWDTGIIDEIMMTRNPLRTSKFMSLKKGAIKIKNHSNIWT